MKKIVVNPDDKTIIHDSIHANVRFFHTCDTEHAQSILKHTDTAKVHTHNHTNCFMMVFFPDRKGGERET